MEGTKAPAELNLFVILPSNASQEIHTEEHNWKLAYAFLPSFSTLISASSLGEVGVETAMLSRMAIKEERGRERWEMGVKEAASICPKARWTCLKAMQEVGLL